MRRRSAEEEKNNAQTEEIYLCLLDKGITDKLYSGFTLYWHFAIRIYTETPGSLAIFASIIISTVKGCLVPRALNPTQTVPRLFISLM